MPRFLESIVSRVGFLFHPIDLGPMRVSVASLATAVVAFLLFLVGSKVLRRFLRRRVLPRFSVEEGLGATISRVLHHVIVVLGAWVALGVVGVDLSGLTVVAGLLSVGIGFGLQNVASNFISGLILVFERPIKVGDRITVGDVNGDVREINLRSTTVITPQNISIIVPNSEFISGRVVNWSHGDRKIRVHVPVGVAYGSDVQLVSRALLEEAEKHPGVMRTPAPKVWFTGFGDSSLNFELLVWIPEPAARPQLISDFNYAIDATFRRNNIEIPFPQRDVHVRSGESLRVHRETQDDTPRSG